MTPTSLLIAALLSVASASDFNESDVNMDDPMIIGKTFLAGGTDPTQDDTGKALTAHGIAEKLFTVDRHGHIVGQVAEAVSTVDNFTWDVTLNADKTFSDGTAVTAQHVAQALAELNTVNWKARAYPMGVMTVTAVGETVRIVSQWSTPVMDAILAQSVFVVYLRKPDGTCVFTGPYAVETFVENDRIELVPNMHYPQALERPPLVIKKYPDGDSMAAPLEDGSLDMAFHLPANTLADLREDSNLTIKSFAVGYHCMMFHQMRRSPLSDVRVRTAVDIAIDRSALTQALAGGTATRSLFPAYTPYYLDESQVHGDISGAEALLDEAGWVLGGNGLRAKDGTPLAMTLVAYPQRPGLVIMQPVIEQVLSSIGITVTSITTSGENWDQLEEVLEGNQFDLMMWEQNTLPAGDPHYFLNNFFRSTAGGNLAGLNSSEVDGLLSALHSAGHDQRVAASAAAHTAILGDVPVSNLVTQEWHVGLSSRMSDYEPWGSDDYVIRADLFVTTTTTTTEPATTTTTEEGKNEVNGAERLILGGVFAAAFPFLISFFASGFSRPR